MADDDYFRGCLYLLLLQDILIFFLCVCVCVCAYTKSDMHVSPQALICPSSDEDLRSSVLFCFVSTRKMAEAEPARKKRRGGQHQRMEQAAAEVERDSALESLLLESFASGEISGAFCHALMQAAVQDIKTARDDGATFPLMEKLASVKHGKNFQQSLELALQQKSNLVQPTQVSIPSRVDPRTDHPATSCFPMRCCMECLLVEVAGRDVSCQQPTYSRGSGLITTRRPSHFASTATKSR